MIAIMDSITTMLTRRNVWFSSITLYIIKSNVYRALSKRGPCGCFVRVTEPHAPADNLSVVQVPVVITNCAPGSAVEHFHSARPVGTTPDQSCILEINCNIIQKRMKSEHRKRKLIGVHV